MEILKKTLVATGVATAVLAAGAAQAAAINNNTAATTAQEIVNESVRTTITPVATVVTLAAGEDLSVDDSITFTLGQGGLWKAITNANLVQANGTFAIVSGGVGKSFATYRVTASGDTASTITLAAAATVTGTAIADNATLTVQADMSGFVGGATTALFGSPLVSFNTKLVPTMTAVFTPNTGVFQVGTGFTTLAAGSNTSGNATVTLTIDGDAAANVTTVGAPIGVPTPAKTLIAVSGPMTGIGSINAANIDGSSAAGVATALGANLFTIDVANNVATGTTTDNTAATIISMVFDGTIAYPASAYTATVSMLADVAGGYGVNANIGTGALFSFTRNGSAFATNSFGVLNKLTVTDRSGGLGGAGADGAITLSAFDAAGAAVTCTGLTITNVPNNGTTTITGADVQTACAGAKRVEGIVNSTSILVSNTKVAADGATSQSGLNGASTIAN